MTSTRCSGRCGDVNLSGHLFDNGPTGVAPEYVDGMKKIWLVGEPLDHFITLQPGAVAQVAALH